MADKRTQSAQRSQLGDRKIEKTKKNFKGESEVLLFFLSLLTEQKGWGTEYAPPPYFNKILIIF